MPTKTMLRAPELAAAARRTLGSLTVSELDAQAVFAWRDVVAERDDSSQVEWLAAQDAELVRGDATIRQPGVVEVDGRKLRYDRLLLSTGFAPAAPPLPGTDRVDHRTNAGATPT